MKQFLLILTVLLIGCKEEKSFADDIVLSFPKETEMKVQEFNEDLDELGLNLIYKGNENPKIDVKYYKDIIPSPEPIQKLNESNQDYDKRIKNTTDSINFLMKKFFRTEEIIMFSENKAQIIDFLSHKNFETITSDFQYDFLSNENLEIVVKEKAIIPLYKQIMGTTKVKTYKAFPIFIKNISDKVLKIPNNSGSLPFYFQNDENKFQYLRNSNYMICGTGSGIGYFELKPNEILIYAFPYFKKGQIRKAKMKFYNALSREFEISIDEKIIRNQRSIHYLQ